jgi:hypothetical protein
VIVIQCAVVENKFTRLKTFAAPKLSSSIRSPVCHRYI